MRDLDVDEVLSDCTVGSRDYSNGRRAGSGNEPLAEMGSANSGSDGPFLVTRTVSGDILWVMKSADEVLIVVQDNRGRRAIDSSTGRFACLGSVAVGSKFYLKAFQIGLANLLGPQQLAALRFASGV